ncbi:MAG: glycosyltransferase family 4 protein, partial [Candidatus Thorarchaeota archaeon]
MKRLNMLMIGLDYHTFLLKGSDFYKRLKKYLKHFNISIIIVSPYNSRMKNISAPHLSVYFTNSFSKFFQLIDIIKIFLRIARKIKFNLVTTQDPFVTGIAGLIIGKIFNIPSNIQVHSNIINNQFWLDETFINYFQNILAIFVLKNSDTIRVVSDLTKVQLKKHFDIKNKFIKRIPVFADIKVNQNTEINEISTIDRKKFKIFSLGRLSKEKNFMNLVKSAQRIKQNHNNFIIFVGGDGSEKHKLESEIKKRGLQDNIILLGYLNSERKNYYYRNCDVFVNVSNYEGFGLVCLEAMYHKKPIIMTKTVGKNEMVINEYNGFRVKINDPIDLSDKIMFLMKNPDIIKKLGENAYNFSKDHYKKDELLK